MSFRNRWRIDGKLKTTTLLHIGSGASVERTGLLDETNNRPVQVAAVAVDAEGRAYIPGTALKGNLRAWLQNRASAAQMKSLFGEQEFGGSLEFWDACVETFTPHRDPGRYWDAARLTSVAAAVAIERRTRTASPQKLIHYEFVPPGVTFQVTISAQDVDEKELALVLYALSGFGDARISAWMWTFISVGHFW